MRGHRSQLNPAMPPRVVSVLCAARNSAYHQLGGVEVYDVDRDARTFQGGTPIVGHPPCRAWSAFLAHQAKPSPGEKALGLWVADRLRDCGGVLEHPAHSRLFESAGLPKPGEPSDESLWSIAVWQAWWGYRVKKATWLCFSGVPRDAVSVPYCLHARGNDNRRFRNMSKNQRSATNESLAAWLVAIARAAVIADPN